MKWVIMSAGSWMRKPSIEKIIKENKGKSVITVATLFDNSEPKQIFILGAGDSSYGENGQMYSFIKDTGNGHRGGGTVRVENTIIINEDSILDEGNGIGLDEKRSLWVFK